MKVRHKLSSTALAAGLLTMAASAPAAWPEKLSLDGYIDAYYQQNLNGDAITSGPGILQHRAFDTRQNQFDFGGGELNLEGFDEASETRYHLDLILGPKADIINAANMPPLTNSNFMVGQAHVTKGFGDLKFTFGKMATFIGTESWNTVGNMNYSRGLLFQQKPFYHTGLSLEFAMNSGFEFLAQIDNGNSVDVPITEGKGYGLKLGYKGMEGMGLSASWYSSPLLKTPAAALRYTDFVNVLMSLKATDMLSLNLEYLYVTSIDPNKNTDPTTGPISNSPKTNSGAIYINWLTPVEGLSLIPRFEKFSRPDNSNTPGASFDLNSYTLTVKIADGPLTHYVEYRCDASNLEEFPGRLATDPGQTTQQTLTYAAAYGF